jgi:hypothetical protein
MIRETMDSDRAEEKAEEDKERGGSDLSKHNFDTHRPPATGHHCIQTLALLHKTSGAISQFVMFIDLDKINYPFPITKT